LRLELDFHGCRFLKSGDSFVISFVGCSGFIRPTSIRGLFWSPRCRSHPFALTH
jgi:hypothetical protein